MDSLEKSQNLASKDAQKLAIASESMQEAPILNDNPHTHAKCEASEQTPILNDNPRTHAKCEASEQTPILNDNPRTHAKCEASEQTPILNDNPHTHAKCEASEQTPILNDNPRTHAKCEASEQTPTNPHCYRTLAAKLLTSIESPGDVKHLLFDLCQIAEVLEDMSIQPSINDLELSEHSPTDLLEKIAEVLST